MTAEHTNLRKRIESNWPCVKSLSRGDLELERQLHHLKWFDYRFISPMEATLEFRAAYSEIFQRKYAMNIDSEEAKTRTGVRAGTPFQVRTELTSFWRARQTADFFGLPYRIFIEVAFDQLTRGGWARLPHVNQLYAERNLDRIHTAAVAYWEEFQQTDFDRSYSHLPEYRSEAFHEFPAQVAHRASVIELVKRKSSAWAIGKAYVLNRVISPELARATFDIEKFDRAADEVAGEAVDPLEPMNIGELLPSCFGLPGACVATSTECLACPAVRQCNGMVKITLAKLKATEGTEDPEHERRKRLGRARTRRCRAKKALGV